VEAQVAKSGSFLLNRIVLSSRIVIFAMLGKITATIPGVISHTKYHQGHVVRLGTVLGEVQRRAVKEMASRT
jgi:hypothetical protein